MCFCVFSFLLGGFVHEKKDKQFCLKISTCVVLEEK